MTTNAADTASRVDAPKLDERLTGVLKTSFPRFSENEMARRRAILDRALEDAGLTHALLFGNDRRTSPIQWLTENPSGQGHLVLASTGEQPVLFVKNPNNLPLAKRMAPTAEVRWSADGPLRSALKELERRGALGSAVAAIGPLGYRAGNSITQAIGEVRDLSPAYTRMRMVKSAEEMDFMRIACALSDAGMEALGRTVRPGLTESDLADVIERAYVPWGGLTQIHYVGVTSMNNPDCCVPAQLPSMRPVAKGDIVFAEISAAYWGYAGQVLRSFTIDADPNPLYRDLYAMAEEAYQAIIKVVRHGTTMDELLDAAMVIDRSDFTICDDLVHGYGGGYLPPILGTRERPSAKVPDITLEENMTIVVQPSIMTQDGSAGVQTGNLMRVTRNGLEILQHAPEGFRRVGT
jgi:Xaa-Pro dipeptidase